jgi:prepilin-type N-terminal cleavage/methylation domain-containing protein
MARSAILRSAREEEGFTLIELLIVVVILTTLVLIAVPSYLSLRASASQAAAQSNVRSALPAAESYYQSGATYAGMNLAALQLQAPGVSVSHVVVSTDGNAYCLDASNGGRYAYYVGGDQNIGGDGHGFHTDLGANYTVGVGYLCASVVAG